MDRVGLGWRGELSASIFENMAAIDVLEVIAEDWLHASARTQRALRALGAERPVMLHGVAMGMASCAPMEMRRLDRMARLFEQVRPLGWSEHLAFVRGGGVEIGHLAAPPWTPATVEGAVANIARATRIVGAMPALENIATLVEPPVSTLDEAAWTGAIVRGAEAPMLLDLHNLYANAVNFGHDPAELMTRMPLERATTVHLSGGRWIRPAGGPRLLLDDHLHDVPDPVFALLETLAAIVPHPLTVIIERDGLYPDFRVILAQLARARRVLAAGRAMRRKAA